VHAEGGQGLRVPNAKLQRLKTTDLQEQHHAKDSGTTVM